MPERCLEALLNPAKTPSDFAATWLVIVCEPLEILEHDANQCVVQVSSWFKSKTPRKHALAHGCNLARALMHLRSFTVLLGAGTSKMRFRLWNLSAAASDHGRQVARSRGSSAPQGGDEDRFFFAEMMGGVSPPASAASLANRSAFSRAVFSTTARLAASYSAMALAPSRA